MSKRCTAFDTRYRIHEEDLKLLKTLDPTGSKCMYLDYIYRQFNDGTLTSDTYDEFARYLQMFEDNKSHLVEKDINKYDIVSLRELFHVTLTSNIIDDVEVLYDGPYGNLSIPLSYEASCKLGSGTQWCTASSQTREHYDEYITSGPLYIWYDKNWNKGRLKELNNKSKKFQFQFPSTFMDETDDTLKENILRYFITEHPVISLMFKRYEESNLSNEDMTYYVFNIDRTNSMGHITKYILGNYDRERFYIELLSINNVKSITDLDRQIFNNHLDDENSIAHIAHLDDSYVEKYIYPSVDRCFEYAELIRRNIGIEDIDTKILLDSRYTYRYLKLMKVMPKKIETDNIVVRAIINRDKTVNILELNKLDHDAAIAYARDVLRCRCKAIETENDYHYNNLFKEVKLRYGHEQEYISHSKYSINLHDYIKYYKEYGRSELIERYAYDRKFLPFLADICVYCYNAPASCCLSYIDEDIETLIRQADPINRYYEYIFYGIGEPSLIEHVIRRMLYVGETQELCDKLISMNDLYFNDILISFNELSITTLKYILTKSRFLCINILIYVALGERPDGYDKKLESTLNERSSSSDLIAYQLYWKKFMNGINMPIFEKFSSHVFGIYYDNYRGKIEKCENATIIEYVYLRSRVRR